MEQSDLSNQLKFCGKVVLVTGSGTGIGQSIAKKFAYNGASVIILGRRPEPLEKTASDLKQIISMVRSNATVRTFPGVDVSEENSVIEMFKAIKKEFGNIDILVNNAGVSGPVKLFTNSDFKEYSECVHIHLTGTYWTTIQCLETLKKNSKIITISTFFTEENRWEQRPYRFRTPYTSAQGAKNRLVEALAWELGPFEIKSVGTNPGPVHSDRIYKTVYPKAAAEFLRIGGYPGFKSSEINQISPHLLNLLGEDEQSVHDGLTKILKTFYAGSNETQEDKYAVLKGLLTKIEEIAEKVQANTRKMIVGEQFLSQDEVAEMVLNLCQDSITKVINGRIIPNDAVFYPVRPIIGTITPTQGESNLSQKVVILIINSTSQKDHDRGRAIADSLEGKVKQLVVLVNDKKFAEIYKGLHCHSIDLSNETSVKNIFTTARDKFSSIGIVVLLTGQFDYNVSLLSVGRGGWDVLVQKYLLIPAIITRVAALSMVPLGAIDEPSLFRSSNGKIIIVGPDAPVGKKISGLVRARSEIFRGGLRPFNATVNQELRDVLGSNIRQHLVLCGNVEGKMPNNNKIIDILMHIMSDNYQGNNQTILYPDES